MICASLYRPFFIVNLLRYLAEKILLLNTANLGGLPHTYLAHTLTAIVAGHKQSQINELLPWNYVK